MLKSLAGGGLAGGLVLFLWGAFSYMALPWHATTLNKFTDETVVSQTLTANAPESGMYILPNPHKPGPETAEGQQAGKEDAMNRMMRGPFLFAAVSLTGTREMGQALLLNVAGNLFSALLATWLLLQTAPAPYGCRVGFIVTIALAAAVIAHYPSWIWWRFSTVYMLVECADLLIGWTLAGLAIATLVPACRTRENT